MMFNRGFTLIELIVTMAVMGILATIAAPSMSTLVNKQRLNTTSKDLAYVFGQARGQAAVLRKDVTVKFESGSNTMTTFYWLSKYDDIILTSDPIEVTFTPIGLAINRSKEISNPSFDATKPESATNPKKVSEAVPLSFSICSKKLKETRTINISRTGVIEKILSVSGGC